MLRCAICPIALAGALAAQAQPGKELIAARSALRASGSPVFLADLAKPLPPPAQNAALTYGKLIANNAAHPEPKSVQDALDKELAKSSALTPREWDNVRAALADESVRLSLIHQAVTLPYGVFEHNLKDPHPENMLLPEFVTLRAAARLVTEQSLLMAHDGKAIAAVENERLGFQIAAQSDSPPKLIISYLAANSIEGIALAGLRQILTLSHGDGAAAAAATQSIPPNLMGNHKCGTASWTPTGCTYFALCGGRLAQRINPMQLRRRCCAR